MEKDKGIDEQDIAAKDNRNRPEQENSANGLDSLEVRDGQDGRNDRFIGSTDMDSANGLLRFNDQDSGNPGDDITEEGQKSVAGSGTTNTSTVEVTTHGPDDYASAEETPTPKAQKKAKEQDSDSEKSKSKSDQAQEKTEEDVANTGTSTEHKPVY